MQISTDNIQYGQSNPILTLGNVNDGYPRVLQHHQKSIINFILETSHKKLK